MLPSEIIEIVIGVIAVLSLTACSLGITYFFWNESKRERDAKIFFWGGLVISVMCVLGVIGSAFDMAGM